MDNMAKECSITFASRDRAKFLREHPEVLEKIINTTPCLKYLLLLNKYHNSDTINPNTIHPKFEEIYNYLQYAEIPTFSQEDIKRKRDTIVIEINKIEDKYRGNSQIKLILNYIINNNEKYKIIDMLKNANFISLCWGDNGQKLGGNYHLKISKIY
jgi:hypothetical protein